MTPARLREIVTALRSPEGWAGDVDEMNEAFFALADLAGIDRPDADLETIEARAGYARTMLSKAMPGIVGTDLHRAVDDVSALAARVRRAEARLARAEDTIVDMRAVLHDAAVDDDER